MKVIIIGGVAGGATLAARLRRRDEKMQIVLFEKGEYVSYANCGLPYYIGNVIADREKLFLHTVESLSKRFDLDIRIQSEVLKIDISAQSVLVRKLTTGEEYTEHYDKLVLSTGAEPIRPPLPGIDNERIFLMRNVPDTDKIKSFIRTHKPAKAVVIGGGFIGLEMAENLHHAHIETSIVEKAPQVMDPIDFPMAAMVHRYLREQNIPLFLGERVGAFELLDDAVKILLESGKTLLADMVILSIGVRPDVKPAKEAGLLIGGLGGISVDKYMQTSDKNVYALGDAVEVFNPIIRKYSLFPLAGPANKQARIVADNITDGNIHEYKGTIGTSIAKIFDMTVAATGASSKLLDKEQIPHITSFTHGSSHAAYYPDAQSLSIKINFSPDNGKLLGAQVVGFEGVDKRIDLFAQVIKKDGTIYDLQEIEHAYAPPFSSAKDPVNVAGFVAENILTGKVKIIHADEIDRLDRKQVLLIDTRTEKEFASGHIEGAINIPLDFIRERLTEISKDKKIVLYCAVGLRGYLAARILEQRAYTEVYNLSGGYKTYKELGIEN